MKLFEGANEFETSRIAADLVAEQLAEKPDSVLGLATGSSPVGLYDRLADLFRQGLLDFSHAVSFNLDEYVGLAPDHEQSYRFFMEEKFFKRVAFSPEHSYVPLGVGNPEEECKHYDQLLRSYGRIDFQILGIGLNGHIGFNEPSDSFIPDTHVVKLSESTRRANARFFREFRDVPEYAITMGIRPILGARTILLLAFGREKASILKRALEGPVTPQVPASILQIHPNLILVGDREALSQLDANLICS